LILNAIKKDDEKDDFTIKLHDSHIKTEKMYEHLKKVDVKSIQNLHPNDRRKIIRYSFIFFGLIKRFLDSLLL
jgi:tRNA A37 N6-isopentenylltransferase MiaA